MKKAIFAGSFDPFTEGHLEIVKAAKNLFSELVVAIALDTGRVVATDADVRRKIAFESLTGMGGVTVQVFSGLLTDFMAAEYCVYLVRGLRDENDFLYEQTLFSVYKSQMPDIMPVYLLSSHGYRHVSGTVVRDLARLDGNLDGYVAKAAQQTVYKAYKG